MLRKSKILTIIGTRPEAIKLAPVVLELNSRARECEAQVCVTGQHREMLDQVLALFDIKPAFDLNVMQKNQTLTQLTGRVIQGLGDVVSQYRPDIIIVQGDTTSAFCGALVAYYHRVRVGHVEAGLRTGNKFAPFPEEGNRRLIAPLSDWHFAPTAHARLALLREGVPCASVLVTGNTVIDALLRVRDRVRLARPAIPAALASAIDGKDVILVTGHRRESFGDGFENICYAIRTVAERFPNSMFVYPVHLNPNVREPVNRILGGHDRIRLIEPLPYEPFVWLMDRAKLILTDSGGVQEEAPSLGKPVLVMRETTERPEGIAAGNARLVGTDRSKIVAELSLLLTDVAEIAQMTAVASPYGDGQAATRIVDALLRN